MKKQDWIKDRIREFSGKDQNGLAEAIGVHPPQITDMISGKRIIKARELPGISNYLEMPVEEIVTLITSKTGFSARDEALAHVIMDVFGQVFRYMPTLKTESIEKFADKPFETAVYLYSIAENLRERQIQSQEEGKSEEEADAETRILVENTIDLVFAFQRANDAGFGEFNILADLAGVKEDK